MKRKAKAQPETAVSAVAARRKAQQGRVEPAPLPASRSLHVSEAEPPLKKRKSSPPEDSRKETVRYSRVEVVIPVPSERSTAQLDTPENAKSQESSGDDSASSDSERSEDEIDSNEIPEDFRLSRGYLAKKDIVYNTKNSVCLRLKVKSIITVLGQYSLWVKRGVVGVLGAKLPSSPQVYKIYAPSTHSLPVIKAVSGPKGYAEIELSSFRNGLPRLRRISDLYRRIWSGKQGPKRKWLTTKSRRSFSILHHSSEDPLKRHLRPLHLGKEWSIAIQTLSNLGANLRVMTCGPKGSGKSTFNKYLLNHLLSPSQLQANHQLPSDGVAYLDLDPGQPEFSTPGQVYLAHLRRPVLGPSFSHPALICPDDGRIVRSQYIGAASPKDDPDHYIRCVMDLLRRYRILLQSHPRCPLIINYPGWVFGQGLEIATWLIKTLDLSNVVYMSVQGPEEVIVPLQAAANEIGVPVTCLPSQPTEYTTRSGPQLRSMQMLSYFHMLQNEVTVPFWSDLPLQQHRSMSASYSGETQGIFGIMVPGFRHDSDHLDDLLDGSIVGIVALQDLDSLQRQAHASSAVTGASGQNNENTANHCDSDQETEMTEAGSSPPDHPLITRTAKSNLPYLFIGDGTCSHLDPASSYALGVALIRSINTDSQTIQLVTPMPLKSLRGALDLGHRIILVRGCLDNPNWALSEEYFAVRAAQRRHRRLKATMKGGAEAQRQYQETSMRLAEQLKRTTKDVPWMHAVGPDEKIGRRSKKLWKVTKRVEDEEADGEGELSST